MHLKETNAPRSSWKRRFSIRSLLLLSLGVVVCIVAVKVIDITLGPNLHRVDAGSCLRAAQPSPSRLKKLVAEHGIRTVFNLRGTNHGHPWYEEEIAVIRELGVDLVDVSMSAHRPLPADTLQRLIDEIDRAQTRGPLLFHCWHGGDRTGLASAFYLLLQPESSFDEASEQLSWRFGHNPWGKARCQDEILNDYRTWLAEQNLRHSPDQFRRWAREGYRYEPAEGAM